MDAVQEVGKPESRHAHMHARACRWCAPTVRSLESLPLQMSCAMFYLNSRKTIDTGNGTSGKHLPCFAC